MSDLSKVSAEQLARDMLERMEVPDAQGRSAGDVGELANLIASLGTHKCACKNKRCKNCKSWRSALALCEFPASSFDNGDPAWRRLKACGPEFGCINFEWRD